MPAKKPTKSRTSKSKLSKKNSAPRWVIGVVLTIVVATGAFLVYNSFASTSGDYIYCSQGYCQNIVSDRSNVGANQQGKSCTQSSARGASGRSIGFKCR